MEILFVLFIFRVLILTPPLPAFDGYYVGYGESETYSAVAKNQIKHRQLGQMKRIYEVSEGAEV